MKKFMDKDFLLSTKTAQKLYHKMAADMPIIDYHCHVNPKEIFEDKNSFLLILEIAIDTRDITENGWKKYFYKKIFAVFIYLIFKI